MAGKKYDVAVIGAGPGGYVAAIRAAHNGANVALIEKELLGGTCLNIGCIPTKTLIASAEVLHLANTANEFGIKIDGRISVDWRTMMRRKEDVVNTIRQGISGLLKASGVTVYDGKASFKNKKSVKVSAKGRKSVELSANKFIIATGSQSAVPKFIPESDRILTSTELLNIKRIPKSLIVLGGGVIGCEFACLFSELGTDVTVVEMMDNILPNQDREISRLLTRQMKKSGIKIMTGKPMENFKATSRKVIGNVDKEIIKADYMLVSIGRQPVIKDLNIQATGLKTDENGWIKVNKKCRTAVPNIYAIGDITGKIWLAHWASAMGICAADNITGKSSELSEGLIPGCIFTKPEIASVGMTLEQCKEKGIETNVGKFSFAALGKALAINETEGVCKIIADAETDQVLGIHIIGPHATDLISEAVTALNQEITATELGKAIHPHPTLGEIVMEAAHAVHNKCIHLAPPKSRRERK